MGIIYATTMDPTKHELIAGWLPEQDFFQGIDMPKLETVGGFRLEDPDGEVGMEFILVADWQSGEPVLYHVPLSYRGEPLPAAEAHLLGTSEHGVLGMRYIYDGPADPVWRSCVQALFDGQAVPQHQNDSDTEEPRVTVQGANAGEQGTPIEVVRRPQAGDRQGTAVIGSWALEDDSEQFGAVLRKA